MRDGRVFESHQEALTLIQSVIVYIYLERQYYYKTYETQDVNNKQYKNVKLIPISDVNFYNMCNVSNI